MSRQIKKCFALMLCVCNTTRPIPSTIILPFAVVVLEAALGVAIDYWVNRTSAKINSFYAIFAYLSGSSDVPPAVVIIDPNATYPCPDLERFCDMSILPPEKEAFLCEHPPILEYLKRLLDRGHPMNGNLAKILRELIERQEKIQQMDKAKSDEIYKASRNRKSPRKR